MHLLAVRVHQKRPGCFCVASNDDHMLGYPTFIEDIDDTIDTVLKCIPSNTETPDFDSSTEITHTIEPPIKLGQAFRIGPKIAREFLPFDMGFNFGEEEHYHISISTPKSSLGHTRPVRVGLRARPFSPGPSESFEESTRDNIPSVYVPDSCAPKTIKLTNHQIHKYIGNLHLHNYLALADVCVNGKVVDLGKVPPSVRDFTNIKKGCRGQNSSIPPIGHAVFLDIGYGNGISPGGHKYCLVAIDAGSRHCWCYGLRDLGGQALCDALLQLFLDMKQQPKQISADFDTKLIQDKQGTSSADCALRRLHAYCKQPFDQDGQPMPPPKTDSYTRHFAAPFLKEFPKKEKITTEFQREFSECPELWQDNPVSAVKTFATRTCTLC